MKNVIALLNNISTKLKNKGYTKESGYISSVANILNIKLSNSSGFGIAAIKDPMTGKIYTGDWRGHKGVLNKAENETIRKRLWEELFKDNSGRYSDYVGFVNKNGVFISREKAENALGFSMQHDWEESELLNRHSSD